MLIWYSESFKKEHSNYVKQLKLKRNKKTDLDFFFPTIIDLFKIKGIEYDKSKKL